LERVIIFTVPGIVNRDIAPFLKSLAPFWYLSRSDPHLQAALLAEKSFSLAFTTEEKRRSAVIFCHAEILGQIQDNLLSQVSSKLLTQQTLSFIENFYVCH